MSDWLIDEHPWAGPASSSSPARGPERLAKSTEVLDRELGAVRRGKARTYAVRLGDIVIHENRKWFGEADIRVDALVIHGRGQPGRPESFYAPGTFRFSRVSDGDRLPIGEGGLIVFLGKPRHFLDIFITVSRDTRDTDELAALLSAPGQTDEVSAVAGKLYGLAAAAPETLVFSAALQASLTLGNLAYRALRQATSATVGLYRGSWLQHKDGFGIGRHPEDGLRTEKDFSFCYEILLEG